MSEYIFMYMFKYVQDHVCLCCVSCMIDNDKKRMRTSIYCRHDTNMDTGNDNDNNNDPDADTGADTGDDIDDDNSTGTDSGAAGTDTGMDKDTPIFTDEATLSSVFRVYRVGEATIRSQCSIKSDEAHIHQPPSTSRQAVTSRTPYINPQPTGLGPTHTSQRQSTN